VLYNENEPFAAQWLENLIAARKLPQGRVDRRSIVDIKPDECSSRSHFFAGIGGWPLALKLAGWPERAPVWTGSCPCQPFSQAGHGKGFLDERHLWPAWFKLIDDWHPPVILGEQIASPAGLGWFDVVCADLEGAGYTCEAVDLCASSVGAPHIRQRLYFVAIATGQRRERFRVLLRKWRSQQALLEAGRSCETGELAEPNGGECRSGWGSTALQGFAESEWPTQQLARCRDARELGNAGSAGSGWYPGAVSSSEGASPEERFGARRVPDELVPPGATAGFWANADWWFCQDGKARSAEPGSFPLASGISGRVGQIRAYGNAICVPLAVEFIKAVMEVL
jgi:DNA (cytosine-5)-methyltransferase 1